MDRPQLLAKAEQIAAYYGQGQQLRSDQDGWLTCCPAHEDSTPSLHITVTDKILVRCMSGCTQGAVINQMKADGLWVIGPKKEGEPKPKNTINIPAHRVPEWDQVMVGTRRPTEIYNYVTEDGEPAFWVLRVDESGKKKIIRPYSSVHYDDGDRFELALNCTVRPLYKLNEIKNNPDKTILVVEGERTCEEAQKIFPDLLVTTWSGGTGGIKKTVWGPLKDRKVILWPDNDGPGIQGMYKIAGIINAANENNIPLMVFDKIIEDLPDGWDLADKVDNETNSPEYLLSKAESVDIEKLKSREAQSEDAFSWIKKYATKYIRVLENGSLSFYNLQSISAQMDGTSPYVWINGSKTLHEIETVRVFDVFTQKPKYAIDYWLEDITQPIANGMVYDPSQSDLLVRRGNNLFLNTFPGFAYEPIAAAEGKIQPFLDHVRETLGEKEADFLLDYVAHMVQMTTQKPGTMIILTGKPGVGKTVICDIIAHMLGRQNAIVVDSAAFTQSNFNGLFSGKLFVTINELNVATRRDHTLTGKIKSWITDENYTVNAKFQAQRNEKSFHRFMATTNSDIPFPIDTDDRRIALFSVGDKFRNHPNHFVPLFKMLSDTEALAGLMYFFSNRDIKQSVMRPPQTEARKLAYHAEDPITEWLFNILYTGVMPNDIREKIDKAIDWARYGVVIPRSIVVESIMEVTRNSLSKHYITQRLTDQLRRRSCPPHQVDNQINSEVYDKMARSYTRLKDRVFEFMPLDDQRELFEKSMNTKIVWPTIVVYDSSDPQDNVVPIKKIEIPF
jgi:hypothetical protein